MIRRPLPVILFALVIAAPGALYALDGPDVLPPEGQEALKTEYTKWNGVWNKLVAGDVAFGDNPQNPQAIDAAAKWATYRLTWGLEKEPGKINELFKDFNAILDSLRNNKEKTQKVGEMFAKQVIAHAAEVLKSNKAVNRFNAARLLARLPEQGPNETPTDVLGRLAGTNEADLAAALTATIKDPDQVDAAKYWAFRALRYLLVLPQPNPPLLPRASEEAALEAVVKFLQDNNKAFPPGTPQTQIDGFRLVRREAIEALAQGHSPTLPDKSRPAWVLLKIVARDGVTPEPRLDERVEAAIGVAHARPDLDATYQPDYAVRQLGLFAVDYANHYAQAKQGVLVDASVPWRVDASRMIEALEQMKAQAKNVYVGKVVDETVKLLSDVEKGSNAIPANLEQAVNEPSPSHELYKGDAASVIQSGNPKDAPAENKEK